MGTRGKGWECKGSDWSGNESGNGNEKPRQQERSSWKGREEDDSGIRQGERQVKATGREWDGERKGRGGTERNGNGIGNVKQWRGEGVQELPGWGVGRAGVEWEREQRTRVGTGTAGKGMEWEGEWE